MPEKFSHDDVFPVIARLIRAVHDSTGTFVTHDELVRAVLNDREGHALVEAAREADDAKKSSDWWASNMVQWFSQRITEDKPGYQTQFERQKIQGSWAYKSAP